jgi:4-amino-4-deoxy-L-arabinose transferase-like glycosyltransferase
MHQESVPGLELEREVAARTAEAPVSGPLSVDRGVRASWSDKEVWSDWTVQLAVWMLAFCVFLPGIGAFGLWDPWEVHYGEVGRSMVERHDWISPWWGSYWRAPGQTPEGEYFFSKPVLLLWMMGLGLQVFGFTETGIRIGVALIAIMGVVAAYMAGSHVWSRRVGVLMAGTLLTSPFYFMLGRQAQTDMPFVGMMSVALCFFMMGVFGKFRNRIADRATWFIFITSTLLAVIPQLHTITVGQLRWRSNLHPIEAFICYGPTQLAFYISLLVVFVISTITGRRAITAGQVYLWAFYAFVGLATMGKGILGFALPGAIIFLYLVISREWSLLRRVEIPRGILVALFVGFPWYGAVLARHGGIGGAFWDRFIIHDHFKRLATGVHQTDNGSFEHFIRQLGYGLFPWGSFVPAIVARAMGGDAGSARSDADRARIFLYVWFGMSFTLFTMSSTKFHHYIFPAVPAVAFLAALVLDDVWSNRVKNRSWWPLHVAAVSMLVLVGFDLMTNAQTLKNMFTYKYDREWNADWDGALLLGLRLAVVSAGIGLLLIGRPAYRRLTQFGIGWMLFTGLLFSVWTLNDYMPRVATTWSQKGLWDRYYELCTQIEPPPRSTWLKNDRYCLESAISYKLNWRGETYYTQNDILPIRNDEEWAYFKEQNGDRCFFAIMEHGRVGGFRGTLPAEQRDSVLVVHDENIKFALVSINCPVPEDMREEVEGSGTEAVETP